MYSRSLRRRETREKLTGNPKESSPRKNGRRVTSEEIFYSLAELGSNPTVTSTVSSFSAAMNVHCFTAFTAQSARIGFPPRTWTSFTDPLGVTTTRIRTVPPMPRRFNTEGYCADTDFTTLRLELTSCAAANPAATSSTRAARASIPRAFRPLICIPTFPLAGQAHLVTAHDKMRMKMSTYSSRAHGRLLTPTRS